MRPACTAVGPLPLGTRSAPVFPSRCCRRQAGASTRCGALKPTPTPTPAPVPAVGPGGGYLGPPYPTRARDTTSSASERRFKAALEARTGVQFVKAWPPWLRNPATGAQLELDLWNAALWAAIEYDGPHHWTYPNAFHKSVEEFERQRARDAAKDALCAARKVALLRVRASLTGSLEEELAQCVARVLELAADARDAGYDAGDLR